MPKDIHTEPAPRTIREPTKRIVRRRCSFGCVICGFPFYHYDHIVNYAETLEHDPSNITLLCGTHHDQKTRGLLASETVIKANEHPYNTRLPYSSEQTLFFPGPRMEVIVGTIRLIAPLENGGMRMRCLIIDDKDILSFRQVDKSILVSASLFDRDENEIVNISDNELVVSTSPWDVKFEGQYLTVLREPRDILRN